MPVKYWSSAGLMLTDWCNASCACCYATCSPAGVQWMSIDDALTVWAGLIDAGAHGCRVHLTGGEVFGRFDYLLDLCRRARGMGLGPLEAVETNGFWADDPDIVVRRLTALDAAGMDRLTVSTDPYHQQYVPIERVRMLVRLADEILGADRVRVRWRQWLTEGRDLVGFAPSEVTAALCDYAAAGHDRLTGRAAEGLDGQLQLKPATDFDDKPCKERILRGRHVHVAPTGEIWPATCVGIVVGNALQRPVGEVWSELDRHFDRMDVIGVLACRGPVGLLEAAQARGFIPRPQGYASKCQLCFHVRRRLHAAGAFAPQLGPSSVYVDSGRE